MEIIDYKDGYTGKIALALGFFDSVHAGHRQIIAATARAAKETGGKLAVFTFCNDPFGELGGDAGLIYGFDTRVCILCELGVEVLVFTRFDRVFMNTTPAGFTDTLFSSFDVGAAVTGEDYRYGVSGTGDAASLRTECCKRGIKSIVLPDVSSGGARISSTRIRGLLAAGRVEEAAALLGAPYRIYGTVVKGRGVGAKELFPTANIEPEIKPLLRDGVYAGMAYADNHQYNTVINIGARPTFAVGQTAFEAHLIGYQGDLYGKELRLDVKNRIRDIKKFDSAAELKNQIEEDIKVCGM
ncbi:MAG: riboflavin biosynthesis protein RibF [Firmicutes bacterium]|nr:riboflavin biosynthesis protein RibF [Bacillota bacterium]